MHCIHAKRVGQGIAIGASKVGASVAFKVVGFRVVSKTLFALWRRLQVFGIAIIW